MRRFLALSLLLLARSPGATPVDFNRDVRPILSEKCYHCHGPDEESRKAKLRLDVRDSALQERDGVRTIVPGKPDQSELMARVRSKDPDEVMPPPKEHHALSAAEIDTLHHWIAKGAAYAPHWAFVRPERPPIADCRLPIADWEARGFGNWSANPIDSFILKGLMDAGLTPSPEAEPETLLRRLSLDLTGLPPTPEEVSSFVSQWRAAPSIGDRQSAIGNLVDRLLASPHFGERWARMWLDLARYADSSGYGSDFVRLNIWPWRDWVIAAFNRNLPYDQFTIEQIAGDLLPGATREQLVATAFHRNTMTNFEGGTPDEEYRVAAVKDRVSTTMQVWMGLTAGCAQCHSHKFDPLSIREYYQLFAIFNQTEDADRNDEEPKMPLPTHDEEKRTRELNARIAELEQKLKASTPELNAEFAAWLAAPERKIAWQPLAPDGRTSLRKITGIRVDGGAIPGDFKLTARPLDPKAGRARFVRIEHDPGKLLQIAEVQVFAGGENIAPRGKATQSSTYADAAASRANDGNTEGAYDKGSVAHTGNGDPSPWWELDLGAPTAIERVVFWNRAEAAERIKGARLLVLDEARQPLLSRTLGVPRPSVSLDATGTIEAAFTAFGSVAELKAPLDVGGDAVLTITPAGTRVSITADALPVREIPANLREQFARKEPTPELLAHFRPLSKHDAAIHKQLADARKQLAAIKPLALPIMRELPKDRQRESRMLTQGNYLLPGEPVAAALPAAFHQAPGGPIDRLALARWLVSRDNPLTARVAVNRFWAQLFGTGIVETEEDFGTQGALPSHPELLDWLAVEFMRDWDVKRLLKLIVTSATYRQSSKATPELLARDPRARLLSRYPRRRLGAEEIRDSALAVAGLLSHKLGGPSVYPPQPEGLWNVAFNGGQNAYKTSTGEDRYRRGIYTFWRRTMPHPAMTTFDAPSRETCTLRRVPTNTPLQAFVTLNDPAFVECAQALARRLMRAEGDADARIRFGLELVLARPADARQIVPLRKLLDAELAKCKQSPGDALTLATNPLGPLPAGADPAEAAAWTAVANVLLNLDAFLTRS